MTVLPDMPGIAAGRLTTHTPKLMRNSALTVVLGCEDLSPLS
jgi:hypothetical protein